MINAVFLPPFPSPSSSACPSPPPWLLWVLEPKTSLEKTLKQIFTGVLQVFYRCFFKDVSLYTAQKMKFSIQDFFSKYDQISKKLRIWSHLLTKSLMKNFIFCTVIISGRIPWWMIFFKWSYRLKTYDFTKYEPHFGCSAGIFTKLSKQHA